VARENIRQNIRQNVRQTGQALEEIEARPARNKGRRHYDYTLLFLIIFISCFGLVMIYSSSSFNAAKFYGDATLYVKKQLMWTAIGIPVMILVSGIDYHLYKIKLPIIRFRSISILYIVCMTMQAAVLFLGSRSGGSQRWLEFGSMRFQPSEITKICIIIFTAHVVSLNPRKLDRAMEFVKIMILTLPLISLVVKENLSTAVIILLITVAICFVASRKKWYFVVAALVFVAIGAALVFLVGYRGTRIEAWLNVETHPKGQQTMQGLYAIASGGLFGKGLGNGFQKLGYISEVHNDMIFTIICEELGLFGAIAVILLYILLLRSIFIVALNAPDLFGSLIAVGVFIHIASQVLINIAAVTATIPTTGIPLPFVSYGGTSLLVLMAEMGIVLSVSNRIVYEK